jgi:hypothetical protein
LKAFRAFGTNLLTQAFANQGAEPERFFRTRLGWNVSLQKLQRGLLREFKRSPAKSCVLLAMLPVAVYFIGPLIWKKGKPGKSPALAVVPVASKAVASAAMVNPPAISWQNLVQKMASDSRMRTAPPLGLRNPFQSATNILSINAEDETKAISDQETVPEVGKLRQKELNPEEIGLRLTATVVGSRVRMATINGKPYRENARIDMLAGENESSDAAASQFVLKTVDRKFVVLEHNGKLYQLKLAR